jgi:hypothetical protein
MNLCLEKQSVEKEVLSLPGKTLAELKKMWKELFKSDAPPYSKKYLIPRLAYRLQEVAYGELSSKSARRLDQLSCLIEQGKKISCDKLPIAGTKFVREYNGENHEVLVTNTGFVYKEQFFTSLSAIAGKITGISYNGPLFFGLRDNKARLKKGQKNV